MLARLARTLALLALGLSTVLAVAFGFVQTGFAKSQIETMLERTLAGGTGTAEVSGLGGLLPFAVRLERLRLADAQGVWLEVDEARIELAPGPLLAGRLEIREVSAERIALHRLPPTEGEPSAAALPELPALPESLPPVRFERVSVPRLELGAAVLGRAAALSVEGRAGVDQSGRRLDARLVVERIDERTAELSLNTTLDLAARTLDIGLEAGERGGLLAAASGLPQAGAARLELAGFGPLARWQGKLAATVEGIGTLDGRIALDLEGLPGVELGLTGRLEASGLATPILAALGERPELALALVPEGPERLRLKTLRLATPALALEGHGQLDLAAETVEGRLRGEAPDLARLAPLIGTSLAGSARIELDATGSLRAPSARLRLDGSDLGVAAIAARLLDLSLETSPAVAESGPLPLALRIEGRAEGTVVAGRALGADGLVRLEGEGVLRPQGLLQISVLDLALSGLEARAAGELHPTDLRGELRIEARSSDLRALSPIVGDVPLPEGALLVGTDLHLAGGSAISADLVLGADRLAGLPPGAAELLGAGPSSRLSLRLTDRRRLELDGLDLRGSGGRISGRASLDLADGRLGGSLALEVPDLAVLTALAGDALAGRATLELQPDGTLLAPRLRLSAKLTDPALGPRRLDTLDLEGEVELADGRTDLRLRADGHLAGAPLRLAGDGWIAGTRLELRAVRLDGPGLAIASDGALTAELDRGLVAGRIAGRAEELARLAPLIGQPLSGAIELEATAGVRGGVQDLQARLAGSRLGSPFGTIGSLRVALEGRDLRGRGSLRGDAVLERLVSGELTLETANLGLDGPLAELGFRLEASGVQAGTPLAIDAQGRLAALAEPRRLELARLSGTVAGQSVELRQPARITLDKGVLDLGILDLKIGEASARIRASHGAGSVRAEAALDQLPLRQLARFGLPALPGTASASLRLAGAASGPDGRLDLTLSGLGGPGAPLALKAGLSLKAGRELTLDARGEGFGDRPLLASARLPVVVDLAGGSLDPLVDGPVTGRLEGQIELARLASLLQLDGQSLAGPLDIDLGLSGRRGAPRLTGRARLAGGELNEAASGLRLRAIEAVATAEGSRVTLERLEARDRRSGRLTGSGSADLLTGTWQVKLELRNLLALAAEIGTATLTGTVEARRSDAVELRTRLEVERAELRLPEPPPAVPATIPVEEVGNGVRIGPEPAAGAPFDARLDIRIDAPQRLFVRGRGLESEWQGRVSARGTLAEPDVVGRIELRRGFLDLLGSRFTLSEGLIEFDGARPPLPRLDVLGTARKADITARVGLRGRAPKFDVVFESEPPLPRDEVLSRVLFGRELSRISPLQGAMLANSLAVLQGGGIDALSPVRRAAGLDTLDVGGDAEAGAALRAGKYLNERVFVEMQRGVTPESGRARVEVDLGNNLRGTSELRETSQTRFGLEWRYDY